MNKSKILVNGGSYMASGWPNLAFPHGAVTNLARSAAGNTYIAAKTIAAIDVDAPPDFVLLIWSSIKNIDVKMPNIRATQEFLQHYEFHGTVQDTLYFFSGGDKTSPLLKNNYTQIKAESWPSVHCIDDYLRLPEEIKQECAEAGLFPAARHSLAEIVQNYIMLQQADQSSHLEDVTYHGMINCQSLMEHWKIPYVFTFVENPFGGRVRQFGGLTKNNPLYKKINWQNYIANTPYEYGLKHGLLSDDNYHLTSDGMVQWATDHVVQRMPHSAGKFTIKNVLKCLSF